MPAYEPQFMRNGGQSNVPDARKFVLQITYGASGGSTAWGKDLAVANTATGKVTVTFPRTYRKLTGFKWGWVKHAAGTAVLYPTIEDPTAIGTASSTGGGTLIIDTLTETGTATNPTNGDILSLEFEVSNDVLVDRYGLTVS